MMKQRRFLPLLLALCLLPVPARAAQTPVVVSFDALPALIAAQDMQVKGVYDAYQVMSLRLDQQVQEHKELINSPDALTHYSAQIFALQESIYALRTALTFREQDLNQASSGALLLAQTQYLNHFQLLENLALAQRLQAAGQEQADAAQLRYKLGMISASQLAQVKNQLPLLASAVEEAQAQISENRNQLAAQLNLSGEITLAGLPELDPAQITQRDLPADRAAYLQNAPAVVAAKQTVERAKRDRDRYPNKANNYAYTAAQAQYKKAQEVAGITFAAVYDRLLREYGDFSASTVVQEAAVALDHAQTQFDLGLLSRIQLAQAKRDFEQAQSLHTQAKIALLRNLLTYQALLYTLPSGEESS